ncbi:MAG: ATP synthase F1 subunit epsilon [Mycoplasmataceae bacterium]|jgi:F-type H+-transporting ATPase subunit epsilon|nr:ATP synthase F1 subunit epsilon [Mycoplasmataceae bacterium]
MAKIFKLKVNTPDGISIQEDIASINLKTSIGELGILAEHEPIIGALIPSTISIQSADGNKVNAIINGGLFKMDGKVLNIITDFFQLTNKLNESVIDRRKEQIEKALANKDLSGNKTFKNIQRRLQQELEQLEKVKK